MRERAAGHDAACDVPADDLAALRGSGAFLPPPASLCGLLTLLGECNLSVGRLIEAHVNALQLIARFGRPEQREASESAARSGHLFGLWVTDALHAPVLREGSQLRGAKAPCSGVGAATRAIVTVQTPAGSMLAMLAVEHLPAEHLAPATGMRAAAQGRVVFDGAPCPDEALVGEPGDYLREPELSCGAWRTSAVTLGGLNALIDTLRRHLRTRRHDGALLQQERFGLALIAQRTARLWVGDAERHANAHHLPTEARVAAVNLARIAVEGACLDALRLVQRSAGLAAFVPGPMERIARDLATYLRQPAPDAVLTEAAAYHLGQP